MARDDIPPSRETGPVKPGGGPVDREKSAGYLDGDAEAFREVDGWIRAELGRRYPTLGADMDDLAQVVHAKLLTNLREGRFQGRSSLRTYVTGIVHHTAIDCLRERYRDRAFAESWDPDTGRVRDNPYRTVEAMDEQRLLHQVLLGLPASCRQLWLLVFVEKLPYPEVARRLGVPEGTVKSRMWHCRKKAAALLRRARVARLVPRRRDPERRP